MSGIAIQMNLETLLKGIEQDNPILGELLKQLYHELAQTKMNLSATGQDVARLRNQIAKQEDMIRLLMVSEESKDYSDEILIEDLADEKADPSEVNGGE